MAHMPTVSCIITLCSVIFNIIYGYFSASIHIHSIKNMTSINCSYGIKSNSLIIWPTRFPSWHVANLRHTVAMATPLNPSIYSKLSWLRGVLLFQATQFLSLVLSYCCITIENKIKNITRKKQKQSYAWRGCGSEGFWSQPNTTMQLF